MFEIYMLVDGERKPLSELPDVLYAAYGRALSESFDTALEPFRNEIDDAGGTVRFEVSEDLRSVSMHSEGISDDLQNRIIAAMPASRK